MLLSISAKGRQPTGRPMLWNCRQKTGNSCWCRLVLHTGFRSSAKRLLFCTNVTNFITKKVKGASASTIHRLPSTGELKKDRRLFQKKIWHCPLSLFARIRFNIPPDGSTDNPGNGQQWPAGQRTAGTGTIL